MVGMVIQFTISIHLLQLDHIFLYMDYFIEDPITNLSLIAQLKSIIENILRIF